MNASAPQGSAPATFVCFGELLLRLTAPGRERLLQSSRLDVNVAGAEANVAVSLRRFGHRARMVSALPESDLGEAVLGELRRHDVDVSHVARGPGRMGLFFLEQGAVIRPSRIVYDRAGSTFAQRRAEEYDWGAALADADWLHISGVTPAIGPNGAEAAVAVVRAARALGLKVSFDGNYRGQLWAQWDGDGPQVLKDVIAEASVAFVNEKDLALVLKRPFESRSAAFAAAFETFPHLTHLAATTRRQISVDDHELSAEIVTREAHAQSRSYSLLGVVDRIGGGDAFAAGVLHGLAQGRTLQDTISFAAAAAALKHAIPGDFNLASADEVEAVVAGDGLDVKR